MPERAGRPDAETEGRSRAAALWLLLDQGHGHGHQEQLATFDQLAGDRVMRLRIEQVVAIGLGVVTRDTP